MLRKAKCELSYECSLNYISILRNARVEPHGGGVPIRPRDRHAKLQDGYTADIDFAFLNFSLFLNGFAGPKHFIVAHDFKSHLAGGGPGPATEGDGDVEFCGLLAQGIARPDRFAFGRVDRKSTRLNSSHTVISYAVFCLKKKTKYTDQIAQYREADRTTTQCIYS